MSYNPQGTIAQVPSWSKEGVPQVGTLDLFRKVEPETMEWESGSTAKVWTMGVRTAQDESAGVLVTHILDGSYIKVRGVDFGRHQARRFDARVASATGGGTIELHMDGTDGIKRNESRGERWGKFRSCAHSTWANHVFQLCPVAIPHNCAIFMWYQHRSYHG